MPALLLSLLRVSVLLAMTLAVLPLLRSRSASLRAWVVTSMLASAALVPLLQVVAPAWGAPLQPSADLPVSDTYGRLLLGLWAAGAVVHLLVLIIGMVRLMGVAAAADPIRDGRCADMALEIGAEYRVHAPILLLEADRATLPVTWGHAQPKILLPPAARNWSDERIRIVLRHEVAHVRRRDWLVQVFATVIRSLYWFHPLVWVACARLRFECERACDDVVLASGVSGTRYASHLLELARSFIDGRSPVSASALAGHSTLERRVRAMLQAGTDRSSLGAVGRSAIAVSMVGLALAAAGFGAVADIAAPQSLAPPRRLTLLLDGRIVDLSKGWPTYPDPRAGLIAGPGLQPELQRP
jgi:beta-lactamase regulating signal transducer with metallopeptidase domain